MPPKKSNRLRAARYQAGYLTLGGFARKVKLFSPRLSKIELGTADPRVSECKRILAALQDETFESIWLPNGRGRK